MKEIVSLRKITKFGCPIPMVSTEKYIQATLYGQTCYTEKYIYVHALTILEERGHEFKGQ